MVLMGDLVTSVKTSATVSFFARILSIFLQSHFSIVSRIFGIFLLIVMVMALAIKGFRADGGIEKSCLNRAYGPGGN